MDYDLLLEGCCEMGLQLLRCGAEIHRTEDTVHRLLAAYGLEGEVFAIPNCIWVSAAPLDAPARTRMRRVPMPSIDVEGIERYNDLSRRLCANPPQDPGELLEQCRQTRQTMRHYPVSLCLFGYFIGAFFFALFFSGGWLEGLTAGLAGLAAGAFLTTLNRVNANFFIASLISAFALGAVAYGLLALGAPVNIQLVIAGAIMVLVPGLVFTNFMRNLLTGDMIAGVATFFRAVMCAAAIAVGTGAAMMLFRRLWLDPVGLGQTMTYSAPLYCLFAFAACLGFCPSLNVQGIGTLLCCLGGALGWMAYLIAMPLSGSSYIASFIAAVVVAAYSEIMARVRKCPATSYLVIAMFPLVPGLTIYQAMEYGIQGNTDLLLEMFIRTFGIAGCLALGVLTVTAIQEVVNRRRRH